MLDFYISYVHVTSDELLRVARRDNESYTAFCLRKERYISRRLLNNLINTYEVITTDDEPLIDENWFRKYTYAFVFPGASEGDFETIAWAYSRQGDGDNFTKSVGRGIAETRLASLLDNGKQHTYFDMVSGTRVPSSGECTVSVIESGDFEQIPDKVVRTMVAARKDLIRRSNVTVKVVED